MCTAFVKKGKDIIMGFNFDLAEGAFKYGIYRNKEMFYIGITVGATTYKTHGVNRNGNFGNLPYMNGEIENKKYKGSKYQRLDLLNDKYIAGKYSFDDVLKTVKEKEIVNISNMSMHSLFSNKEGRMLIVEPQTGHKLIKGNYSVLANFPVLRDMKDLSQEYYGKERYDTANKILKESHDDFSVKDALNLLNNVKQEGIWATRISFVCSVKDSKVYYALGGDFSVISEHKFE